MQLDGLCRVAILNPFQESYLPGERIISFDRAETNHDKVASPKQQSNLHCTHLHKLKSFVFCG